MTSTEELQKILEEKVQQTLGTMDAMFLENQKRSQEAQSRLFGGDQSNVNEEQQEKINEIVKIFNLYPDLIPSITIYLATLVKRKLDMNKILEANPDKALDLMDAAEKAMYESLQSASA